VQLEPAQCDAINQFPNQQMLLQTCRGCKKGSLLGLVRLCRLELIASTFRDSLQFKALERAAQVESSAQEHSRVEVSGFFLCGAKQYRQE
jgi:hypothetical protein